MSALVERALWMVVGRLCEIDHVVRLAMAALVSVLDEIRSTRSRGAE